MLKADAIKYIIIFRNHVSCNPVLALFLIIQLRGGQGRELAGKRSKKCMGKWDLHPGYSLWWATWGGSAWKGCLFLACSILKGSKNCHFSKWKGRQIGCKVEEIWLKWSISKGAKFWQKWQHKTHKSLHPLSNWTRMTENLGKTWRS